MAPFFNVLNLRKHVHHQHFGHSFNVRPWQGMCKSADDKTTLSAGEEYFSQKLKYIQLWIFSESLIKYFRKPDNIFQKAWWNISAGQLKYCSKIWIFQETETFDLQSANLIKKFTIFHNLFCWCLPIFKPPLMCRNAESILQLVSFPVTRVWICVLGIWNTARGQTKGLRGSQQLATFYKSTLLHRLETKRQWEESMKQAILKQDSRIFQDWRFLCVT